jgi:predicted O-methyltransferase YrrM
LTLEYPPSASLVPRWGHGRSPHQQICEILARYEDVYRAQIKRIADLSNELRSIPLRTEDPRQPSWTNNFLPGLDAAALYAFVRHRAPRRYLEIGSGTSTKFAARAKRDARLDTNIVSIDPHPRAEIDSICDLVMREPLETASLDVFRDLQSGDIVFFDGSHRTFMNSDVTVFFLELLPNLPAGTLVGIHDVFLPDDYPPQWTERYYSEQYLLAAYLLAGCSRFEPLLAAWYASSRGGLNKLFEELWTEPRFADVKRHGCAFWMRISDRLP